MMVIMDAKLDLIPPRLCSQACYFSWHICLFFIPLMAYSQDIPFLVIVVGRLAFLATNAIGLTLWLSIERKYPNLTCGAKPLTLATLLLLVGSALTLLGLQPSGLIAFFIIGCLLCGFGNAPILLEYGKLYSSVSVKLSMRALPISLAVAILLFMIIASLNNVTAAAVMIVLPLLGALLLRWARFDSPAKTTSNSDPTNRTARSNAANQESTPRFTKWKISINTAIYWLASGVMWTLSIAYFTNNAEQRSAFFLAVTAIVTLTALILVVATYVYRKNIAFIFWAFVPLAIIGISIVAVLDSDIQLFAFALILAARLIAETVLITHFAAINRKKGIPSSVLYAPGFAILSTGELVGILIGLLITPLQDTPFTMILLVVINLLVISLIYGIIRVNSTLQRNEIKSLKEAALSKAASMTVDKLESSAAVMAMKYSLSTREKEILGFLLSGRDAPTIAERLLISPSTVQTHVKHIYEKTGVHSRQELHDLAESASSSTAS
jgi:DNA-binding CsgD family transcriptional regulator